MSNLAAMSVRSVEVHAKHAGALLVQHIDVESTVEQLQIALAREFGLDASSVKMCGSFKSRGLFSRTDFGLFFAYHLAPTF